MKPYQKTKAQLIEEVESLRQHIDELKDTAERNTEWKKTEQAMRECEYRLAKAQQIARLGFLDWNLKTNELFCSNEVYKMYGISREEAPITPEFLAKIVHPDDIEYVQKNLDLALRGVQECNIEHRIVSSDGKVFWVHAQTELTRDADSNPETLLGTIVDITEHKQAEEKLRQSKEDYRRISENIHDALMINDREGRVLFANDRFLEIFGLSREDLSNLKLDDYVAREWRPRLQRYHDLRMRGNKVPTRFEYEGLRKDGTRKWLEMVVSRIERGGEIIEIESLIRDITERKYAEEELKKHAKVLESMAEGVNMFDENGNIVYTNSRFYELFGYEEGELIGKNISILNNYRLKENKRFMANFLKQLKAKEKWSGEVSNKKKDGTHFTTYVRVSHLELGGKKYFISVQDDITERKKAEMELKKSHEQLRNLYTHLQNAREQERKHIAREIHDELGQELTVMKMNVSLLNAKIASIESSEIREPISREAEFLSEFVHNALNSIRKIVSNLRPEFLEELGLKAAMEEYLLQFQNQTKIKCGFRSNLKDQKVDSNISLTIFRIFQEAITNVARHANASQVNITLNQGTKNISLRVKDNGRGVTEKDISDSKSIGLIGMQERALSNGGKLDITGIPGKGTTIILKIPLKFNNHIKPTKKYDEDKIIFGD